MNTYINRTEPVIGIAAKIPTIKVYTLFVRICLNFQNIGIPAITIHKS